MKKSAKSPTGKTKRFLAGFKKAALPATVFLTGACVLIIEVVATRMLSPYFGNTIFTVSSVISVVLAALSIGYMAGGKLADRSPHFKVFYGVIAISGLSVLLLAMLNRILLPSIGYKLSITSGPLVTAVILFFLPSLLLGMLSPFAIKLQSLTLPKTGIGSIAGGIFFWSTLGSIFGSLSSGFILIPHFGINAILVSTGLLLTALGAIPMIFNGARKFFIPIIVIALLSFSFTGIAESKPLYVKDGTYEKIEIFDGEYQGKPTRFFKQDRSTSGAMYLDSEELVYDYTKYYSLYELFKPDTANALIIGGGAYSIPKKMLKELPNANIDVSEIEPSLFNLGKQYFRVPNDPRLKNHTDDGRRLLEETNTKYDMIFSDVYYSLYSIPAHFTTNEFFKLSKSKLSKDGIFIANIIGSLSRESPSLVQSEMRTLIDTFPNSYYFAVDSPGSLETQNIIFVGYNSNKVIDFNSPEILNSNNPIIRNLPSKIIDPKRFELSSSPILSDDYAPIESLNSRTLERSFEAADPEESGKQMMAGIAQQLRYGPRYLGSKGHDKTRDFIEAEMKAYTPDVSLQTWTDNSESPAVKLTNIVARFNPGNPSRVIIGTHYDSKRYASLDPDNPKAAVPGANDSASGVVEMLEFARKMTGSGQPNVGVDMVFFDGEEGRETIKNDYSGWQPLGSTYFASNLDKFYPEAKPKFGIVLDMVCDKNLNISRQPLSESGKKSGLRDFWDIATSINPQAFRKSIGEIIIDDHTPLEIAGIPSTLVIDFDYAAFHTTKDSLDKCSAKSLQTVSDALSTFVYASY